MTRPEPFNAWRLLSLPNNSRKTLLISLFLPGLIAIPLSQRQAQASELAASSVEAKEITSLAQQTFPNCAPLAAMQSELNRSFAALKKANPPVYYIAYRYYHYDNKEVMASQGSIIWAIPHREGGRLQVEIRVGKPELDNFHPLRSDYAAEEKLLGGDSVPFAYDKDCAALRSCLWLETEKVYRQAADRYGQVLAQSGLTSEEDRCDDFSQSPHIIKSEKTEIFEPVNFQAISDLASDLSKIYTKYPLEDSWSGCKIEQTKRYIVTSEGTAIADTDCRVDFSTGANVVAKDGERIQLTDIVYWNHADEPIKDRARLSDAVKNVADTILAEHTAPLAEPYCGPIVLQGGAAAVLFHEVLGHRLEASRHRTMSDGKTFAKMLGTQILPSFLSVSDRPIQSDLHGTYLNGHYAFDDEGVPAQDVTLVKDGVLVSFLMSRTPAPGIPQSNGHGRTDGESKHYPQSRMANLLVESSKTVSETQLRKDLIAEAKKQGKSYGLWIEKVEAGQTDTSTYSPQLFQVQPSLVKRIYVDGRPDEYVRGVRLVGTPLTALNRIIETSDQIGTQNGYCDAESGAVPQSNSCPSLLLDSMETERETPSNGIPKILPPPEPTQAETKQP